MYTGTQNFCCGSGFIGLVDPDPYWTNLLNSQFGSTTSNKIFKFSVSSSKFTWYTRFFFTNINSLVCLGQLIKENDAWLLVPVPLTVILKYRQDLHCNSCTFFIFIFLPGLIYFPFNFRYSGLVNAKAVGITAGPDNKGFVLTTKRAKVRFKPPNLLRGLKQLLHF
jgi:hypothetical protein